MNRMKQAQYNLDTLCVYELGDDPVLRALQRLAGGQGWQAPALWASFYKCLAQSGFHDNLKGYVEQFVLSSDNVFTRAAAAGRTQALGENLLNAVRIDLQKLEHAACVSPEDCIRYMTQPEVRPALEKLPVWRTGSAPVLG
ncbi:MAG: hypothetical protein LIO46_04095, partial [Clostridiales bacterium]|nr:hypothetical protein [Clostridiales bacterium]